MTRLGVGWFWKCSTAAARPPARTTVEARDSRRSALARSTSSAVSVRAQKTLMVMRGTGASPSEASAPAIMSWTGFCP